MSSVNIVKIICITSSLLSIGALLYFSKLDLILAYGDAESHLNIAKRVVSSITPGLGQLGGNWLPLQHILMLPFIWNDYLWRSGLAGSFVSMIAYVITSIYVSKILMILTRDKSAVLIGSILFMTNPSVLYMQSTPMGELPLLACLLASVYYFMAWTITQNPLLLVACGFVSFCGSLLRYDAWLLIAFTISAIIVTGMQNKLKYKKIEGSIILYSTIALFGVLLWLVWNYILFRNPLFFLNGSYSAHAQQQAFLQRGELISYHDLWYSIKLYSLVSAKIGGYILTILASLGFISVIHKLITNFRNSTTLASSLLLMTPYIFYVLTLYLGISIILIPELVPETFQFKIFNVRYGLMMIPVISIYAALLFSGKKLMIKVLIGFLIIVQISLFIFESKSIVLTDAQYGLSARQPMSQEDSLVGNIVPQILEDQEEINKYIFNNYDYGRIAFDDYSRPANPIELNIEMKNIIYIGNHPYWDNALVNPQDEARWIIVRENDTDSMWNTLKVNYNFINYFERVFRAGELSVYKLRDVREDFVYSKLNKLYVNHEEFYVKGVNSYDIAYRSESEIIASLDILSDLGVNTLRFWLFGDGIESGFQPTKSTYNNDRLDKVDFLISESSKRKIKLIPVLVNNWEEYGGKEQYVEWIGLDSNDPDQFYTNEDVKDLFKKYVSYVITRKNQITDKDYIDEDTILGWEIMNEPRTADSNSDKLVAWMGELADFIYKIDNNHLILSGAESVVPRLGELNLEALCLLENIDICTVHIYLEHDNKLLFSSKTDLSEYISSQKISSIGKPVILEEFGIPKNADIFNQNNIDLMSDISLDSRQAGYVGALVWNWSLKNDSSFGFSPNGDVHNNYSKADLIKILESYD